MLSITAVSTSRQSHRVAPVTTEWCPSRSHGVQKCRSLRCALCSVTPHYAQLAAENAYLAVENAHLAAENAYLAADNAYLAADNAQYAVENAYLAAENAYLAADNAQYAAENALFTRALYDKKLTQRRITLA